MNPIVILLLRLFRMLPWERIVAIVMQKLTVKVDKARAKGDMEKLKKLLAIAGRAHEVTAIAHSVMTRTATHVKLVEDVIADGVIKEAEANEIGRMAVKAWAEAKATPARLKEAWRAD